MSRLRGNREGAAQLKACDAPQDESSHAQTQAEDWHRRPHYGPILPCRAGDRSGDHERKCDVLVNHCLLIAVLARPQRVNQEGTHRKTAQKGCQSYLEMSPSLTF